MTVSTNVPRERWNQPHEREHLAAASLWRTISDE